MSQLVMVDRRARESNLLGMLLALIALGTSSSSAAAPSGAAELTVTVDNISPRGGILRLGIYTEDTYYSDTANPVASFDIPAHGSVQMYQFENLPPGSYAIEVLQDFNGDGKMDFNWVGLPTKPFGFSKNAVPYFGRPSFERVEIRILPGKNTEVIHLQRYLIR